MTVFRVTAVSSLVIGALSLMSMPLAAQNASAAPGQDGFHVTPEVLTATGSGSNSTGTSSSTNSTSSNNSTATLGLAYDGQKTWNFGKPELNNILAIEPGKVTSSDTWSLSGLAQVKASGKIPANRNVDVGDTVDLNASGGGQLELNGDQRPFAGYSTLQGNGSFEYGQRTSTKNYAYGVASDVHFYPTPAAPAAVSWLNVFDWPGKLLRPLSMDNAREISDQPRAWPAAAVDFDRVDPQTDVARKAVDPSLASYNRLHEKISAATQLGKLWDGRDVVLSFRYDHWQQINAPQSIEAAHLASQTYRQLELVARGTSKDVDWVITFSNGATPADQASVKLWQLGWRFNFSTDGTKSQ